MKELKNLLTKIGLTQNESKCYLSLIEKGPLNIQELSRRTNIHRVNIYQVIDGLEVKGCVNYSVKNKYRKKVIPASPRHLVEIVNKKQRELKKVELKLKDTLPELLGSFKHAGESPAVRFFEGLEGVKQALDETLTASEDLRGFSNAKILNEYLPEGYLASYWQRKSEKGLRGRFLIPDNYKPQKYINYAYLDRGYKNYPTLKTITADLFQIATELDIYDDKVCIVSLKQEEKIAIIIKSNVISETLKSIFETLWKIGR